MFDAKRIFVCGAAGKMGLGIVETILSRMKHCEVVAYDMALKNPKNLAATKTRLEQELNLLKDDEKKLCFKSSEEIKNGVSKVLWFGDITDAAAYIANSDAIIEAIFENESAKKTLYKTLEKYAGKTVPIFTNTSTIKIAGLAESLTHPERFMGLHFFNPVPTMKGIEAIPHTKISTHMMLVSENLGRSMGKTVLFAPDTPGFVVNGGYVPAIIKFLEELQNGAKFEDIDRAFKTGKWVTHPPARRIVEVIIAESKGLISKYKSDPILHNFSDEQARTNIEELMKLGTNMPAGPFELDKLLQSGEAENILKDPKSDKKYKLCLAMGPGQFIDLVGIDVALDCVRSIGSQIPERGWTEPELLLEMQKTGKLGQKSGSGFYRYKWPVEIEYPEPGYAKIIFGEGKRNSLSMQTIKELRDAFAKVAEQKEIVAVFLKSRGKNFAVGADITEFPLCLAHEDKLMEAIESGRFLMSLIGYLNCPVIGMHEGLALGGAYELLLACDLIVSQEGSRVGLPEKGLGIIPGWGGTQRLTRRVGLEKAKWMILGAEEIKVEPPWVDIVLKKDEMASWEKMKEIAKTAKKRNFDSLHYNFGQKIAHFTESAILAARVTLKKEPKAASLALRAIWNGNRLELDSGLYYEWGAIMEAFQTGDAEKGIRHFLETGKHLFKKK